MVQIFIEAKRLATPEGCFLQTIIKRFIPESKSYEIIPTDGWTNLFCETNVMKFISNSDTGGENLVIFDADYPEKENGGYENRLKVLKEKLAEKGVTDAHIFLWPDNESDGDFETLLESLARKELYQEYFDCFDDYEKCIAGPKDANGINKYHWPNQKARMYTYISSMQLSKKQRDRLSYDWLFEDNKYWYLDSEKLAFVVAFLKSYL